MAPSRKEHAPGIAGGAVHERLKRVAVARACAYRTRNRKYAVYSVYTTSREN